MITKYFFRIKNNPKEYFPDVYTAQVYLQEILGNQIPLTIQWKVDGNDEYPVGQTTQVLVTPSILKRYVVPLPIIGRKVKAIRLISTNYPVQFIINKMDFWHPSLEELTRGIEIFK